MRREHEETVRRLEESEARNRALSAFAKENKDETGRAAGSNVRMLKAVASCQSALIRAREEKLLLGDVCRILVEEGGCRMAWVGFAEQDPGRTVRPVAQAGFEPGFLASIRVSWGESSPGSGPMGAAIRSGKPFVARRIPNDPACESWRAQAAQRGYAAVACLPLTAAGRTLGALALYAPDPESFDEDEASLFQQLAGDLAFSLMALRSRAEGGPIDQKLLLREWALQTALQPMAFADLEGRILYANPAFLRLWECDQEEDVLGKTFASLAARPEQGESLLRRLGESGQTACSFQGRLRNGKVFDLDAEALLVRDEMGTPLRVFATFTRPAEGKLRETLRNLERERSELSLKAEQRAAELQAAREVAEAASRTKTDFLAGMSHELRTPLNAVIGFSEVLLEPSFGPLNPKQTEYVGHILESGTHLQSLIDDILAISKAESGGLNLEFASVDLRVLLEECRAQFAGKCRSQELALDLIMPDPAGAMTLQADSSKIRQILANLLSNALKFTPKGGRILITGRTLVSSATPPPAPAFPPPYLPTHTLDRRPPVPLPCVEIVVSDSGIGVEKNLHEAIFTEFFQVQNSPHRKPAGTGLGLALTRLFVNMHGGQVWVESEGHGKGSRFVCVLPLQRETST